MIRWAEGHPYGKMTVSGVLWFFIQPTLFGSRFTVWVPDGITTSTGIRISGKFNTYEDAKQKANELFLEWLKGAGLMRIQ